MKDLTFDIVVVGAGSAGLVVAIGGAKAGKKVLLIEKGEYGGDCTNFGCIPSKSLIASSHVAHLIKRSESYGIKIHSREMDPSGIFERLHTIVNHVKSHEDPAALEKLGVATENGSASFIDKKTLLVNGKKISGKHIVLATGSCPIIPPIPGLEKAPFLTNETIFSLKHIPQSMVFIGGGPICCELAQAFNRLGTKVTIVTNAPNLLIREEPEAQEILKNTFAAEGITVHFNKTAEKISYTDHFTVTLSGEKPEVLESEALFVGTGRRPNLDTLQLEKGGVRFSEKGVEVDRHGRTNIKNIWAVGDITGPPFFTHNAEHQARTVLKNLLLPFSFKTHPSLMPRCTYTDPEVASIGLKEEECSPKKIAVYSIPFCEVDRCITCGRTEGLLKIVTKKWSSKILGATVVGPRAGEMLMEIATAMYAGLPLRKLTGLIHPYPIENGAIRKAADLYLTQTLLGAFRK
ncbi:MAG: FAD-dependent oxidoreductase [Chlamydiia bacterium]|nr:FAD-dependent oxidoreductase [Chlamydiia bacterium]